MSRYHGALIQVSLGYSPDRGRFHTRSAPVRRSQGCKHPLPLDLHVLGLPLAFILSQDQTLHRIVLNKFATNNNKEHDSQKKISGLSLSLVSNVDPALADGNLRCQFQYLNELLILVLRAFKSCFEVTHCFSGCKCTTLF